MMKLKGNCISILCSTVIAAGILLIGIPPVPAKADVESKELQNPVINEYGITTWDCIYFGHYPQELDENGMFVESPIKWRVLSVNGNDAFLMADKNLDAMPYNVMEDDLKFYCLWDTCTLRSWLNGYDASYNKSQVDYTEENFINRAFTAREQEAIPVTEVVNDKEIEYKHHPEDYDPLDTYDKVYLLDFYEVMDPSLGFINSEENVVSRVCLNTAYTASGGSSGSIYMRPENTKNSWMLRSPGEYSYYVDFITEDGGYDDILVDGNMITSTDHGVRPVIHLDLSYTDLYTYAGTYSSRYTQKITAASQYQKSCGSEPFNLNAKTNGDGTLSFSSDNEAVATVDELGNVTAQGVGEAMITVTASATEIYEEASKDIKIVISQGVPEFHMDDCTKSITDETFTLKVDTNTDGALSYSSSEPGVAEISPDGTVTLKQLGKTQITVTSEETNNFAGASASMWLTVDKAKSTITLKSRTATYTGKTVSIAAATVDGSSGKVSYLYYSDKGCTKRLGSAPKNAGTYYVRAKVAEDESYQSATSAPVKLTIKKASATIKAGKASAAFSAAKIKKNAQSFSIGATANSKGKVTYAKQSGSSRLTVSKTGKVTVKKGTVKGTYKIKVKIKAAAKGNYKTGSKTVIITVKVK